MTTISCSKKKNDRRIPQLPVIKIESRTVKDSTRFPASVEAIKNIEIRPKVSGFIQETYVDEGAYVEQGDVLFELEVNPLEAEAQAASDAIGIARADRENAQVDVDKIVPLVKDGIISEVELEKAKARLRQADARLKESEGRYRSTRQRADYSSITSPVSGRVNALPYRLGSLVGPTDAVALTTVSKSDSVYVYFSMDEKEFLSFLESTKGKTIEEKISNYPPVTFELANGENYESRGSIQTTTGTIDEKTGSIAFRAIFPNPKNILINGYSGIIKIPKEYEDVLTVPAVSTYKEQTLTYVFQLKNKDTLYNTMIETDKRVGSVIIIASGLKTGDTILAKGLGKVRDSTKIKPMLIPIDSMLSDIKKVFRDE